MPIANPEAPFEHAPGAPGIPPTWTSSAKDMVGTSLGPARLWFTTGFGIVNEIYWPRVDIPQIRDLGFIVAGPGGFWSEVKRNQNYALRLLAPGVPAVEVVHTHERYTLRLRITPDPRRDVLAIECRLDGDPELRLYVLLAPHLGATGYDNIATIERYGGRRVLWGEQGPFGMGLAAARQAPGRRLRPGQRRLCRHQRRLAGFRAERRNELGVRRRRPRQCRPDRRIAAPRRAGARLWQQRRIGRDLGDLQPDPAGRQHPSAADRRLGDLAGALRRAQPVDARPARCDPRAGGHVVDRAADASRQDLPRRHGGAPQRALGLCRQRARRLPSRLAARSRAMRRRALGVRRRAGGARHAALSDRDANRGRPLEPEP